MDSTKEHKKKGKKKKKNKPPTDQEADNIGRSRAYRIAEKENQAETHGHHTYARVALTERVVPVLVLYMYF